MTGTELRGRLSSAWKRCGAFFSETLALSAEAGFYPDPLHLGPLLRVLYSREAQVERRRADAVEPSDARDVRR